MRFTVPDMEFIILPPGHDIMTFMLVYLNSSLVEESQALLPVTDRGFLYGDGLFETMRAYGGRVFLLDRHMERLERSASQLGLALPLSKEVMCTAVHETVRANGLKEAYVRLTLTRGSGPAGLGITGCTSPTLLIVARQLMPPAPELYESGVRLLISRTIRNHPLALPPGVKSLNFLNNILARREAEEAGAFEAVMLNHEGFLAEGSVSNVFFVDTEGTLCTPSPDSGILEGITRGQVLELAGRLGLRKSEGRFKPEALALAKEVFITNSTLGLLPVSALGQWRYEVGPLTRQLSAAYARSVREDIG